MAVEVLDPASGSFVLDSTSGPTTKTYSPNTSAQYAGDGDTDDYALYDDVSTTFGGSGFLDSNASANQVILFDWYVTTENSNARPYLCGITDTVTHGAKNANAGVYIEVRPGRVKIGGIASGAKAQSSGGLSTGTQYYCRMTYDPNATTIQLEVFTVALDDTLWWDSGTVDLTGDDTAGGQPYFQAMDMAPRGKGQALYDYTVSNVDYGQGGGTISETDGSSSGSATVTGVSGSVAGSDGSSACAAVVSGVSGSTAATDGDAAGAASVTGDGSGLTQAEGSSTGAAVATADAVALAGTAGAAAGSSTVTGDSQSTHGSTGSAAGVAVVTGDGENAQTGGTIIEAVGSAAGSSVVTGQAIYVHGVGGSSVGSSAVSADVLWYHSSDGSAAGAAAGAGVAGSIAGTDASSAGQGAVVGQVLAFATSMGGAAGLATVLGEATDAQGEIPWSVAAAVSLGGGVAIDTANKKVIVLL